MKLFDKLARLARGEKKEAKVAVPVIPQAWLDAAQAESGLLLSREEVEAARQAESAGKSHDVNMIALRQSMLNHLTDETLLEVATTIGFAPSQLFGGKGRKVMGLIQSAERNGLVTDLLLACQTILPDIEWQ